MLTIKHRPLLAVGLLTAAILLAYGNTFTASWHLDDYRNITRSPNLRLSELTPKALYDTFFFVKGPHKRLNRPVARLTLALNWYAGQENVVGYHLVNIGIHLMTGLLLFMTGQALLRAPGMGDRFKDSASAIAWLAALLWSLNPIHTQAVTYIVQRMAIMAAMFYLAGLYLYVSGRQAATPAGRRVRYGACVICFFLAVGSKENAVTLPMALVLVEVIFFRTMVLPDKKKFPVFLLACVLTALGLGLLLITQGMPGPFADLLDQYATRSFTLKERLLTEARIVVFYLSQILYPAPWRLSIEHAIQVSTGWWHPWTTLPAIVLIVLLIGGGLANMRRRPLLAFGLLFFFLNHAIESSVIPLELIFEHRNYLPSLFLFLPVAALFQKISMQGASRGRRLWAGAGLLLALLAAVGFGFGTHWRNRTWLTEKSLWEDACRKAPGSARAYHNLAWSHYHRAGLYREALKHYKKALQLREQGDPNNFPTFLNVAVIYADIGDYARAILFYREALKIEPAAAGAAYSLARTLIAVNRVDEARGSLDKLRARFPENADYLNLEGFIRLKNGQFRESLVLFEQSTHLNPDLWEAHLNRGVALGRLGQYRHGRRSLLQAHRLQPDQPLVLLALIENCLQSGEPSCADPYVQELLNTIAVGHLQSRMDALAADGRSVPLSWELLFREISEKIAPSYE